MVRTVLGDIDEDSLGVTYTHDHLIVRQSEYSNIPSRILLDDIEKTEQEIKLFKLNGGNAIVDVQPFGAGRDVEALKKISENAGINIITATGLHKLEFYKEGFWSQEVDFDQIAGLFIKEIESGAYLFDFKNPFENATKIKAGIIKIATDENGLTDYYKKIFKSAVIAQQKTGAPIITHTELSSYGIEQAEYLINNGVLPGKIIISHMDKKINLKNIIQLAKMGVFLEFDSIARFKYHSNEDEIRLIISMIENGFENQILVGMDSTSERFLLYGGKYGLGYILTDFIPLMRKMGIDNNYIQKMIVNNPAVALKFS